MLFYLKHVEQTNNPVVENNIVKAGYEDAVCDLIRNPLCHNFNIGGKFNDTYISRLSSRHRFLRQVAQKTFAVQDDYAKNAKDLIDYIKMRINEYLNLKLGNLIMLKRIIENDYPDIQNMNNYRRYLDEVLHDRSSKRFREFLEVGFDRSSKGFITLSYGFEICMFSILRVFLAKFGCKLYRDTRTYAADKGGDISTNFGVVYQIKNYYLTNEDKFTELLNELLLNFSDGRIQQGNVFLIVKDVSNGVRDQLRAQSINCITKEGVTGLLDKLDYEEKREVLVCLVREFKRELVSDICRTCRRTERESCPYAV